ncbi:hypothetical protein SAMN05660841_00339 [Sphingobacterium nematocida]|uniref:Uncharacterized protein n=1 Tax=Sphingobacterium nematocida TaxID=1513896 RepID=A0A1T5B173_9SPHI|nr:hypothetical protein [Sphingobacterium nematocida]SKB40613.1 hypothetical protein SAMN05660841_00339 [Sphingobacterium nematocida]
MNILLKAGRGLPVLKQHTTATNNLKMGQDAQRIKENANNEPQRTRDEAYSQILSSMARKIDRIDFDSYCPSRVIENFWTKYNWNKETFNLFDLILAAKGTIAKSDDADAFLDDFEYFIIAQYTIYYINYDYDILGFCYVEEELRSTKEGVRRGLLTRLVGIQGRGI